MGGWCERNLGRASRESPDHNESYLDLLHSVSLGRSFLFSFRDKKYAFIKCYDKVRM